MVSIIVPIYNVEEYLKVCMDSLIGQTYADIEIVGVDDGSTDGSGQLLDRIAADDARIVALHQTNGGLSAARNAGLAIARGELICFVDSDDWLEPDYVERMLQTLSRYKADMVVCGYVREGNTQETVCFDADGDFCGCIPRREAIRCLDNIFRKENVLMVISWNKLFRREVLKNISYPSMIHEDEFVIHRMLQNTERVVLLPEALYHYRERTDSITGDEKQYDLRHLEILAAMEDRLLTCDTEECRDFFVNLVLCYFEHVIQLLVRYRESDFRQHHLNRYFRQKAGKIYFKYLGELTNRYRLEYIELLISPLRYRNKILKIMKKE